MGLLRTAASRRPHGIARIAAYCGILFANYAADRVAKALAVIFLKGNKPLSFAHGLAILTYAENGGAFLGMGAGWPATAKGLLFVFLPLAACAAGLLFVFRKTTKPPEAIAALCIIGGGLGNLQDRVLNGGLVVDFMNFGIGPIRTGILNVGDLSVTFGALVFVYLAFQGGPKPGRHGGQTEK